MDKKDKILIVDDEVFIGSLLQDILETDGFESTFAENLEQAIACMSSFKPTLALVDYKLVGTTGFEVAQSLKGIDPDIPIILMTAYPSLELAVQAIQSELYDFLAKPIDKAYLYRTITKAIEKRNLVEENKRLIQSLKESNQVLDRLNQMKSKFLSIVTHDLRSPLVSIQGYSEILHMTENITSADKEKCFQAIQISTERMKGLINNLMDMVSIESGRLRVERRRMDYLQICKEVEIEFAPTAQSKKLELNWVYPSQTALLIEGDSNRLVQILTNLISNAMKHTPEKGKITVQVIIQHNHIRTEVADTGEGIDPKEQPRIFEPFYQVESSESKRQGLGLGLSIVKEIVEAHQGFIGVTSAGLNKGSQFYFTLPLLQN